VATQKQVLEAYRFARQRLVAAFVRGMPDGREVECRRPGRPVAFAAVVSVVALGVVAALGLLRPSAPNGWNSGKSVIVDKDTGSRFVMIDGELHPVLNLASARLAATAGKPSVVRVSDADIASAPRGLPVGIPDAPDALPTSDRLLAAGWSVCTGSDGKDESAYLGAAVGAPAPSGSAAYVRTTGGDDYLVTGGVRYRIDGDGDTVLRALGAPTAQAQTVADGWLDTFPEGPDLKLLSVPGEGVAADVALPAGVHRRLGQVVRVDGELNGPQYYVVTAAGLAPVTKTVADLLESPGVDSATQREISTATTLNQPFGPAGWPAAPPTAVVDPPWLCATYQSPAGPAAVSESGGPPASGPADDPATASGGVTLRVADSRPAPGPLVSVGAPQPPLVAHEVYVQAGAGAVVTVQGTVFLLTDVGVRFPVTGDVDTALSRLGYSGVPSISVPRAWLDVFPEGSDLDLDDARQAWPAGSR